jgi:hypothetical protein
MQLRLDFRARALSTRFRVGSELDVVGAGEAVAAASSGVFVVGSGARPAESELEEGTQGGDGGTDYGDI